MSTAKRAPDALLGLIKMKQQSGGLISDMFRGSSSTGASTATTGTAGLGFVGEPISADSGWKSFPIQMIERDNPQTMYASDAKNPRFLIRKIRNGFILRHAKAEGCVYEEDFCADLKEVGERVTAILVQYELQSGETS